MKIVAFGHRRYVGKDTASNFLMTHLRTTRKGIHVVKTGFSSKLKEICHDLYGWAALREEDYYEAYPTLKDEILPIIGKSPREVWIEMGTTVGRAIYDRTWIEHALHRKCDVLIFKDLRFLNEAQSILEQDGYVIRIDNSRLEKYNDVADSALANFEGWSAIINNEGSMADLNKTVIELAKELEL